MPADLISCLAAVCSHLLRLAHWVRPLLNDSCLQRRIVETDQPSASQGALLCEQCAGGPARLYVGRSGRLYVDSMWPSMVAEVLACIYAHRGCAALTASNLRLYVMLQGVYACPCCVPAELLRQQECP